MWKAEIRCKWSPSDAAKGKGALALVSNFKVTMKEYVAWHLRISSLIFFCVLLGTGAVFAVISTVTAVGYHQTQFLATGFTTPVRRFNTTEGSVVEAKVVKEGLALGFHNNSLPLEDLKITKIDPVVSFNSTSRLEEESNDDEVLIAARVQESKVTRNDPVSSFNSTEEANLDDEVSIEARVRDSRLFLDSTTPWRN